MANPSEANTDAQAALSEVANQSLQAWKRQFDTAMQLVETMTEGAVKMREWQLQAAVDAHADAAATQRAAGQSCEPAALIGTEMQWMRRNVEQAASYWRILFETGLETNANLLKCLLGQGAALGLPAPSVDLDASKGALLDMVETAYAQWLEANRCLCGLAPQPGPGAGAATPGAEGGVRPPA